LLHASLRAVGKMVVRFADGVFCTTNTVPHAVITPAIRKGDVFRSVFERVVEACIAAGLVGGEGFAVDASLIQADANKQRSMAGQD
jgi:transposase